MENFVDTRNESEIGALGADYTRGKDTVVILQIPYLKYRHHEILRSF